MIAGNGFFKPNISSLVGQLYPDKDNRKDAAYTIFYMGINVGGALWYKLAQKNNTNSPKAITKPPVIIERWLPQYLSAI